MTARLLSSIMGAGCLAGAVCASPLPPYGVNAHLAGDEYPDCARTCDLMRRGSVGCVRVDVAWRFIQPTESAVPDFARFDKVMDEAERNGLEVLPILCGEPPSWAHPFGSHADGIVALADAFARRYRGRFSTLEFFNEPNNSPDWNGGNTVLYAQVMRRVREAVRAVDPAVRLAFGGVGGAFGEYLRAVYEAGGKDAFDVVNIHPYSNPQPPECVAHVRLENQIRTARTVMAEFGDGAKPLIVTEEGWSTQAEGVGAAESTIGTTTEEDQARFIVRACGIAFAMGVESLFVYEFRSPGGNPYYSECHYGIVRDDFSPKPAFAAYRTFANMRPPGSVNADEEWHDADWKTFFPKWSVPGGAKGGMFWSASGTGEIVWTFDRGVRFYDMTGQEITPRALGDGSYALTLSGSPIYWMERSDAVSFGPVTGECGYNFTNAVVRVGVTFSSLPVEDGYRMRAVVLDEGGVSLASADVPFSGAGTYELPTSGEALVPGLRYAFEVSVVDAEGRKVAVADTSDMPFVAANFAEGFSADAGTGKTVGGCWEPEPAIQSGEYLFRGVSDQLFDIAVSRPGVTRVETVFRLESAFLDEDVPDVLADLQANPPRQALAAKSADGETGLSWMMPVSEDGRVVFRELHGVEARLGMTYRCVMETDGTRSPAQVSCLLAAGDGTPVRLVDANGYGWFTSPLPSVEPVRKVGYRGRMHVRLLEGRHADVTLLERTGNSIRLLTNLAVGLDDLELGDFVVDRDGWRFKWTDGNRYMVYDETDGTCHVRKGSPANGLPSFVSHVLGLDAESASSLPRSSIVRSTDPDGYVVSLGDSICPVPGTRIGYVLRSAADPSFGTSSTGDRQSDPTFWVPYRGEAARFFKIEIYPEDW